MFTLRKSENRKHFFLWNWKNHLLYISFNRGDTDYDNIKSRDFCFNLQWERDTHKYRFQLATAVFDQLLYNPMNVSCVVLSTSHVSMFAGEHKLASLKTVFISLWNKAFKRLHPEWFRQDLWVLIWSESTPGQSTISCWNDYISSNTVCVGFFFFLNL